MRWQTLMTVQLQRIHVQMQPCHENREKRPRQKCHVPKFAQTKQDTNETPQCIRGAFRVIQQQCATTSRACLEVVNDERHVETGEVGGQTITEMATPVLYSTIRHATISTPLSLITRLFDELCRRREPNGRICTEFSNDSHIVVKIQGYVYRMNVSTPTCEEAKRMPIW
jgi:hypothetical protein